MTPINRQSHFCHRNQGVLTVKVFRQPVGASQRSHSLSRFNIRRLMPRLRQRRCNVARVNHAGVFGPGAVVGQVYPGVADAGQVLQFEHHGLGIGLGDHGGQGEGGGGHGLVRVWQSGGPSSHLQPAQLVISFIS